jgi:hypothetical protein
VREFAGRESLLQVMAGNLNGKCVGDHLAGAIVVLNPGGVRERNPNRAPVDQELEIDGIGVACGDRYDQRLIDTVHFFLGPAVYGFEILVHGEE